ncbi:MAG: hypothetical protein HY904_22475 [Deltaproteobacteria bacterium]|nr:hypothetical protein [Deltaproteobacteria bacterium]
MSCTRPGGDPPVDVEALKDPSTCRRCHPSHYEEWSGSMHAYAAQDPVFLAMNRRGQEQTGGALGDFCVRCHAPLAVAAGLTRDGLNLHEVPQHLQGVTCYFCHNVVAVEGTHNNPLRLAGDGTLRGGIRNPVANDAHDSAYSPLHARGSAEAAALCGSCHDIVTPAGVELERTFAEWRHSLYARPSTVGGLTCQACHMDGADGPAAAGAGMPVRRVHSHQFPGVDLALTEFPHRDDQRERVQRLLDTTALAELCVSNDQTLVALQVTLENVAAGHAFPSGAAQDRRIWVEVRARRGGAEVYRTGVLPDDRDIVRSSDADLWLLRDELFDADGVPTHAFWGARRVQTEHLPAPTARSPAEPGWTQTHRTRVFSYTGAPPDEVELRVHIMPVGVDVLDELVAEGYLDPTLRDAVTPMSLAAAHLTWRAADGVRCVGSAPAGRAP